MPDEKPIDLGLDVGRCWKCQRFAFRARDEWMGSCAIHPNVVFSAAADFTSSPKPFCNYKPVRKECS